MFTLTNNLSNDKYANKESFKKWQFRIIHYKEIYWGPIQKWSTLRYQKLFEGIYYALLNLNIELINITVIPFKFCRSDV